MLPWVLSNRGITFSKLLSQRLVQSNVSLKCVCVCMRGGGGGNGCGCGTHTLGGGGTHVHGKIRVRISEVSQKFHWK
jgi:hypothetical protein